jgi:hypothetical protein
LKSGLATHNYLEVLVKYRILALLDKLTGHRIQRLCGWVEGYELDIIPMPPAIDPEEEAAFWAFYEREADRSA